MRRTRIKICGLTRPADVSAAVDAGADAIGFVFARSPRQVSVVEAESLAALVPPPVARIGVFVDADPADVAEAVDRCRLSAVQFCGAETPAACAGAPVPVIKTLGVDERFTWDDAVAYRDRTAALLVDTRVTGMAGGTATAFDWHAVGPPPAWATVFLAGGLSPDNVGEAVRAMHPFAVDVSSGVECAPGCKDPDLMEAFCDAVRRADEEAFSNR